MSNKNFLDSKKFKYGLFISVANILTIVFMIIIVIFYTGMTELVMDILAVYIPSSFAFSSVLIGGQSFIDHKTDFLENQKNEN